MAGVPDGQMTGQAKIKGYNKGSTLCILMDFSIHVDTISILSIM